MFARLFKTEDDTVLTVIRIVLGVVFFAHGAQKMLGWFGGYGYRGTMGFFTQTLHIPAVLAFLAIAAEFFGGLALLVGLLSRVAALGIITNMIVATVMVHAHVGFFMNWSDAQKGEGFEYHLLAIALALVTALRGAGALSLDRAISAHLASERRDAVRHGAAESLSHA